MADVGLSQAQLAIILNSLASIDRRLSRIESVFKIPNLNSPNHANPALTTTAAPPSLAPGVAPAPAPAPALEAPRASTPHPLPGNPQQPLSHPNNTSTTTTTNAAPIIPLEPPPEGFLITSRARMQEELDAWTLPRGYSMRIAGAKVTGKRKVRWVCFRGGDPRHLRRSSPPPSSQPPSQGGPPAGAGDEEAGRRRRRRKPATDRASKKCGCPFRFEAVETARDSDVWVLHYPSSSSSSSSSSYSSSTWAPSRDSSGTVVMAAAAAAASHRTHNHGPSDASARDDPRARKLPPAVAAEVDGWLRVGWAVGRIQEELRARGFLNVLNTDLYNRKRLLRKVMEHEQQAEGEERRRVIKTGAG
ncbi:hypothetical protein VTJ83DRAFT_4489 [Remersonia thermophila]|uniref:Uncharacterized protein n=1 Tax=Remersonia thermophila TaxID=72144 RepID=A0ABR4DC89_9PEZI